VDDAAKANESPRSPEAYEAPRVVDLGDVHALTKIVSGSPLDDDPQ
jgi:hypothetical protein